MLPILAIALLSGGVWQQVAMLLLLPVTALTLLLVFRFAIQYRIVELRAAAWRALKVAKGANAE